MLEATDMLEEDEIESSEIISEWLRFTLGKLDYAVDILRVLEIRTWESMTRIPYSAPFVIGLINLRGAIVPVVDLRLRLGLSRREPDAETIILVLNIKQDENDRTMGLVVDKIQDVVEVPAQGIRPAERFNLKVDEQFVHGITDVNSSMTILLNIDELLDIGQF